MDFRYYSQFLWLLIVIVWLVMGFSTKKTVRVESSANRMVYVIAFAATLLLNFLRHGFADTLHIKIFPATTLMLIAGILVMLSGIFFSIWARITLGTNWSGKITLKEDHALITNGPYSIARHPIYTGFLLAAAGNVLISGEVQGLIPLIIMAPAFLYKLSREEKLMREHFGIAYEQYARKTKRLIPFIF
jgi:protein-S-isoprenylcysteine O-methyltransferase Ste14